MNFQKDYYKILGVTKNATQQEIKAAYRKLAMQYHPDRHQGNKEFEEIFKEINEANEILSDANKKFAYDEFRSKLPKSEPEEKQRESSFTKKSTRTYTKRKKVQKELRVYIKGKLITKFYGKQITVEGLSILHEVNHTINPTETEVLIEQTSNNSFDEQLNQYSYKEHEVFNTLLKRPIKCKVATETGEVYYQLNVEDIKLTNIEVVDVVYEGNIIYGTLTADLYGHIKIFEESEVEENVTECFGPTGATERKEENGKTYHRSEFYYQDCTTYWGAWEEEKIDTKAASTVVNNEGCAEWWWLICLLFLCFLMPKFGLALAIITGVILSLLFGRVFIGLFVGIIRWLWILFLFVFLFAGIKSCIKGNNLPIPQKRNTNKTIWKTTKPTDSTKNKQKNDFLITHHIQWQDLQGNKYDADLSVLSSDVKSSQLFHSNLNTQLMYGNSLAPVYTAIINEDDSRLRFLYTTFDSIISANKLDEYSAASMIVSCVQNFPYAVVVDNSCSADYDDNFIRQYLQNCTGDCCIGYEKYGVRTPAELLSDLKGDCDTKALILYEVLNHFGYDVAMLTSNYYKHAIIAIHFKERNHQTDLAKVINGKPYSVWETTSPSFDAGKLNPEFTDMNQWDVSLLTQ